MRKLLFLFSLTICVSSIYAQGLYYNHNLVFWGGTGYSSVLAQTPDMSSRGRIGANIGVGYEYHYKKFILHTGLDVQRFASAAVFSDVRSIVSMRDTGGREFEGIFDLRDNKERQVFNNLSIPLLFGFSFYDVYFLAGGKFQLNVNNKISTVSHVTATAIYGNIIGSDGNGLLYDMPNHGLTTTEQTVESSIEISPVYTASFEIGKVFKPTVRRISGNARDEYFRIQKENRNWLKSSIFSRHYYRLALFCDYGFTTIKNPSSELIVNRAVQAQGYSPALNHMLYTVEKFNPFYAGLKFTLLFEFTGKYPCQCQ